MCSSCSFSSLISWDGDSCSSSYLLSPSKRMWRERCERRTALLLSRFRLPQLPLFCSLQGTVMFYQVVTFACHAVQPCFSTQCCSCTRPHFGFAKTLKRFLPFVGFSTKSLAFLLGVAAVRTPILVLPKHWKDFCILLVSLQN